MSRSYSGKQQKRQDRRSIKRRDRADVVNMFDNHREQAGADIQRDLMRFLSTAHAKRSSEPLQARNETQGHYIISIQGNDVTVGTGPAGAGKTWVATALACDALMAKEVDKIVITRPVVEAEESLGFLPGEIMDKFAPYFVPIREVMDERLGKGFVDYLIGTGKIEIAPLAYMRGRTHKNAFVILDEAQNTTPKQMKLFLTRIGENTRVVINGDASQQDIRAKLNGLDDVVQRFSRTPGFGVIAFDRADVVRSALAQIIVSNYEDNPVAA